MIDHSDFSYQCTRRDVFMSAYRWSMAANPGRTMVHIKVGEWVVDLFDAVTDDFGTLVKVGRWIDGISK